MITRNGWYSRHPSAKSAKANGALTRFYKTSINASICSLALLTLAGNSYSQQYAWYASSGNNFAGVYSSVSQACRAAINNLGFATYAGAEHIQDDLFSCSGTHIDYGFTSAYGSATKVLCPTGINPNSPSVCAPPQVNNGHSSNNTCNPINISTGNKFYEAIDYQDDQFTLARHYNTYHGYWTFNYTQSLNLAPDILSYTATPSPYGVIFSQTHGSIESKRPDGSALQFRYGDNSTSSYQAPSQRREQLQLIDANYINQVIAVYDGIDSNGLPESPAFLAHTHDLVIDNITESYDSEGKLIAINNANDSTTLSYASPHPETHWPASVSINKNGKTLEYIYDDAYERISEVILPNTSRLRYEYHPPSSANGFQDKILRQVTFINPANETTTLYQYLFENTRFSSLITGILDGENNRISSVQYDVQGRAYISEKGPLNSGIERTHIIYNADGTRTVTNELGKQNTYHFTPFNGEYKMTHVEGHASANCAAANQHYTYDANGFVETVTDWEGNVTFYDHNDRGQEVMRIEGYNTNEARTITTQWHPTFNLPDLIIEPEREIDFDYFPNGQLRSQEVRTRP